MQHQGGPAGRRAPLRIIEIRLELSIRALRMMLPAGQQVGSGQMQVGRTRLILEPLIDISLHSEALIRARPIHAKSALSFPPAIVCAGLIRQLEAILPVSQSVDTEGRLLIDLLSISYPQSLLLIAGAGCYCRTGGQIGGARDDVHHAIHRVGTPERGAGATDDLYPIDILQQDVLSIQVHSRKQRRVDAAPVNQDQELVREVLIRLIAAESTRAHCIRRRGEAPHLQIRREAQCLRDGRSPRTDDLIVRDDVDGRRRSAETFGGLRHRSDVDVGELLERKGLQLAFGLRQRILRGHRACDEQEGECRQRRQGQARVRWFGGDHELAWVGDVVVGAL